MKLGVTKLSSAVRLALSLGAVIAVGASGTAFAQDTSSQSTTNQSTTNSSQPDQQKAKSLQTVVVTGSLIRRVDLETSNPVVTIDRAQIQATGKMTLGDLVQQLPAMTGGNVNPQTNNGGGTGASSINLRGLGSGRTLLLLNGQRFVSQDPNSIPASAIERIEVLPTGASTTYGSDAIGGVVNFILRKDYQGAQFTANYGESDHNDGAQQGYSFTFGQTSDKGSIMAGVDYNKQDQVLAGNRSYTKNAISATGSASSAPHAFIGGSTRSAYGYIQLPPNLQPTFGCKTVALNQSAAGMSTPTSPTTADYHCYTNSDRYNYATVNLIMTPQERTNAFVMGTYNLGDHVQVYMNAFYNKTSSAAQLAPSLLDTGSGFQIDPNNYWNSFSAAAGPLGAAYNGTGGLTYRTRLVSLGNRSGFNGTSNEQINTGFKGDFTVFDQNWNWDVGLDYGHASTVTVTAGLPNTNNLYTGPSYMSANGLACGTAAAPTPCPSNISQTSLGFDPFNLYSPNSKAALALAAVNAVTDAYSLEKVWHAGVSGGVFNLPAGTVQLAAGAEYRQEYTHSQVDPLLQLTVNSQGQYACVLNSQCSANLQGGYNVKEVYAETFIPVLTDLPFVKSLNVTIGDRYSRFSSFGSTNNFKFAVEYKPFDDLLLRGTMSQVFRAPTVANIYGAPSSSAVNIGSDPCTGYTGTPVNPACVNVTPNGTFVNNYVATNTQFNAISAGSAYSKFPIKPEQGKSFDLGAVYSPSWAPGLSATVDVWHLYLNDNITLVNVQDVLNLCANGSTAYCSLITRTAGGANAGQLQNVIQPTANLGSLSTGGIDGSLSYKLPQFSFGQFTAGVNATYLKYYDQQTSPGVAGNVTYHDAGHFLAYGSAPQASCPGVGVCLFPRWRANGFVDWQLGGWSASWRMRYIGRFREGSGDLTQGSYFYLPGGSNGSKAFGSTTYNDVSVGYNIEPLNTRVDFGINNAFDKHPPLLYANHTLNANTDPSDFDLLGRYFWGRVTVSF